jgi:hypothetical protein
MEKTEYIDINKIEQLSSVLFRKGASIVKINGNATTRAYFMGTPFLPRNPYFEYWLVLEATESSVSFQWGVSSNWPEPWSNEQMKAYLCGLVYALMPEMEYSFVVDDKGSRCVFELKESE